MENVQIVANAPVQTKAQGQDQVDPQLFQALFGKLSEVSEGNLPELEILPELEAKEELAEIVDGLMEDVELKDEMTIINQMAYLIQQTPKPEDQNSRPPGEAAVIYPGKRLYGDDLKSINPEVFSENPMETIIDPNEAKGDPGLTDKTQSRIDKSRTIERMTDLEGLKSTVGIKGQEFKTELKKLVQEIKDKSQNTDPVKGISNEDFGAFTEIRLGQGKEIPIQRIPQEQEVRIQQNIDKVEASMLKLIQTVKEGDATKMTVTLEPESMGKVDLDLRMENGKISARIFVENNHVREMFDGKLQELATNLQKHNINLEKIQLQTIHGTENKQMDMGHQGSFSRDQGRGTWQNNQNYIFRRIEETMATGYGEKSQEGLSILA